MGEQLGYVFLSLRRPLTHTCTGTPLHPEFRVAALTLGPSWTKADHFDLGSEFVSGSSTRS
jgi:hypothetical protein